MEPDVDDGDDDIGGYIRGWANNRDEDTLGARVTSDTYPPAYHRIHPSLPPIPPILFIRTVGCRSLA
eukprot:9474403-Pyramimonas_sp.AAC.1